MITCILLAAGLSRRFGSPKALANLAGETIIERLQKLLVVTQVDEIIVVLGAEADRIKPYLLNHTKVRFVYNKDYKFGQTSSFKAGLRAVSKGAQALMLLPVDYPFIRKDSINALTAQFNDRKPPILIPSYQGKRGHPPVFAIGLKDEFLALNNEKGLNEIARAHESQTVILPVEDPGVTATFNSREEFDVLKSARIDQG